METVKVKRKGQETIPVSVRRRCQIEEGDFLTVDTMDSRTLVLRINKLPEPGRPVGSEEQRKILKDLERLRENWR